MHRTTHTLLVCGLALGLASGALAQSPDKRLAGALPSVRVDSENTKRAGTSKIDRYVKVLNLDPAQTEAAKSLYSVYQKETGAASNQFPATASVSEENRR